MPDKWINLENQIKQMKKVLIAFSGGADSTLLAKMTHDILGENSLAVTADSVFHKRSDTKNALQTAEKIGIDHKFIKIDSLKNVDLINNAPHRCYYCKKILFEKLIQAAEDYGMKKIIEATNYDDLSDYRPGKKALKELGIKQPFVEEKITKQEIRQRSKELGLDTWDRPSSPCLVTRIPYNEEVTEDKLKKIEKAEDYLESLGFSNFRVRNHNNELARIEIKKQFHEKIIAISDTITEKLRSFGFKFVSLDLSDFRSGSMNIFK